VAAASREDHDGADRFVTGAMARANLGAQGRRRLTAHDPGNVMVGPAVNRHDAPQVSTARHVVGDQTGGERSAGAVAPERQVVTLGRPFG
jgi:hypothetical protein